MASQTLVVSSFTPKLATFNSRSTTRPQLALPKSAPALNYCSSSLPTPSLHLKPFNFKSDFKCQVATANRSATLISVENGVPICPGQWLPILEVQNNKYVQGLGELAVAEKNKKQPDPTQVITFKAVVEAEEYPQMGGGWNLYRLRIEGVVNKVDKVFKELLHVGPVESWCFHPDPWVLQK